MTSTTGASTTGWAAATGCGSSRATRWSTGLGGSAGPARATESLARGSGSVLMVGSGAGGAGGAGASEEGSGAAGAAGGSIAGPGDGDGDGAVGVDLREAGGSAGARVESRCRAGAAGGAGTDRAVSTTGSGAGGGLTAAAAAAVPAACARAGTRPSGTSSTTPRCTGWDRRAASASAARASSASRSTMKLGRSVGVGTRSAIAASPAIGMPSAGPSPKIQRAANSLIPGGRGSSAAAAACGTGDRAAAGEPGRGLDDPLGRPRGRHRPREPEPADPRRCGDPREHALPEQPRAPEHA